MDIINSNAQVNNYKVNYYINSLHRLKLFLAALQILDVIMHTSNKADLIFNLNK